MRPILFRAWSVVDKEMIYIDDFYWFEENGVHNSKGEGMYGEKYELMLSIGKKDRKGREIYEMDIVDLWDLENKSEPVMIGRGCVLWDTISASFVHTWEEWFDGKPSGVFRPRKQLWLSVYVVGNYFQNPELRLTGDKEGGEKNG